MVHILAIFNTKTLQRTIVGLFRYDATLDTDIILILNLRFAACFYLLT